MELWRGEGQSTLVLLRIACALSQGFNALAMPWICGGAKGLARSQKRAIALETMRLAGRGFDDADMITNQRALRTEADEEILFEKGNTAAHGCGWIAAYNTLRNLGEAPAPAAVLEEMERGGILLGKGGTNPFYLQKFLRRRGYRTALYTQEQAARQALGSCAAGIWLYVFRDAAERLGAHYVALRPEADGRLRSYNGGADWPEGSILPEALPMGIGRALLAVLPKEETV